VVQSSDNDATRRLEMGSIARVLVAAGDDASRASIATALRVRGYEVVEAPSAEAVFSHFASTLFAADRALPIDLVIAAVHLRDVAGVQVLAALREAGFDTPFILMSPAERSAEVQVLVALADYACNPPSVEGRRPS
jgi:DNA-binding response OmpR family regulator